MAASSSSASCWRGIIDSCNQICQRNQEVLDRSPSLIILYRSKWRCLTRCYSQVLHSRLLEHVISLDPNEETLRTQELIVSLEALYQTMQEGEVCLRDCTVQSFSQSWLVETALKLWTSTDVVDVHLHDFIWAYATVLEQAINVNISHIHTTDDVEREVFELSKIWADEDAEEDFSVAQELLNKVKCKQEGETSVLADFILQKLAFMENRSDVARDVVPPFLWVDHGSLLTNRTEFLGQGSFGIVYVAGWLGGRFAVKDIFYSEEYQTEPAIQATLRHPNVINLVCCSKNSYRDRGCSMVMELMQKDLQDLMLQRLKKNGTTKNGTGPFSLLEAVDLMLQVAKGMEYLHNLNIMHRDLKSSNILVSFPSSAAGASHKPIISHRAVHIKITDFGMAKAKETSSYFSTKPTGTLFWRAPEIFDDTSNVKYRKAADVYSFGLLCYEILTGKFPFEDTKELKRRVIGGERPELPSYCPTALASYIKRCWDGHPPRRPSFTLICMMLRYFKACILLDNHGPKHSNATHNNWLQYPLSSSACDRINDMLQAKELTRRAHPLPLTILLEMYCCRMILQESKDCMTLANRKDTAGSSRISRTTTIITSPSSEQSSLQINGFSLGLTSPSIEQVTGFTESGWNGKRFARRFVKRIKKFFAFRVRHDKSVISNNDIPTSWIVQVFSFKEIQVATNNFATNSWLGRGFESMYKGRLQDGRLAAIRVASNSSHQGSKEFLNEVELLSRIHHKNLVGLLGYCNEEKLVLVYEFMPNGSLFDWLHGAYAEVSPLSWRARLRIVVDVAQGLDYLHYGCNPSIIHRDLINRNILLNDQLEAKISYYGITGRTKGYLDPEYLSTKKLTRKVDVYSFGVVLLEVVSGKERVFTDSSQQRTDIVEWARLSFEHGVIDDIVDASLHGQYDISAVRKVLEIALACVNFSSSRRPTMSAVVDELKEAERMELENH